MRKALAARLKPEARATAMNDRICSTFAFIINAAVMSPRFASRFQGRAEANLAIYRARRERVSG
jgi:hypothetical protein